MYLLSNSVYVSSVATKLTLKEVWLRNSTTVSFIILKIIENIKKLKIMNSIF